MEIRNFNMNKQGLSGWLVLGFIFLVMALVAGLLGFGLIAGASFVIAKWMVLIFVFLIQLFKMGQFFHTG